MTVPKTREELIKATAQLAFDAGQGLSPEWIVIDRVTKAIEAIESLGVRLVPAEPTERMVKTYLTNVQFRKTLEEGLAAAISASPYAPEEKDLSRIVLPKFTEAKC